MSYYFREDWVDGVYHKLPVKHDKKRKRSNAAFQAKCMMEKLNPEELKIENGYAIVCSNKSVWDYNHYADFERKPVEEEIKQEIMDEFGLEAEVDFWISDTREEEPDPPPPLYWGGTDTVYCYSLTIKIKV